MEGMTEQYMVAVVAMEAKLERIKLEDGVRLHEQVKADLQAYAANAGRPYVKPFMLVIARDTFGAELGRSWRAAGRCCRCRPR